MEAAIWISDGYLSILKNIPPEFRTKEICMVAYDKNPYNIEYFPEELFTQELAIRAVKCNGNFLQYIPEKYKTKEVCLIAVSDGEGSGLKKVPESIIDKEICLACIKNTRGTSWSFDDIPPMLRDYDICYACVSRRSSTIKEIPAEFIDEAMCLAAARSQADAARYIPEALFTSEMAEAIIEDYFFQFYFKDIPKKVLTETICLNALRRSGYQSRRIFREIPDEMITQEMCNIVVQQEVSGIIAVPERFVTEEMLIHVVKRACGVITYNFPERLRTKAFIDKLISINPDCEEYIKKYILE